MPVVGDLVAGVVVGVVVVVAAALIIYGLRGRSPEKPPRRMPQPLTCPEEMTRKSLATYYYAPEPESGGPTTPRSTTWAVE